MRPLERQREAESAAAGVNVTPLIDMAFILLIFFVVTSSFVKEAGVEVERPTADSATPQERASILVGVSSDGGVWIEGRQVDLRAVRGHIQRLHAENPESAVVILADEAARTGVVIQVLDQARLAGVSSVAVAAARPETP